MKQNLCGVVTKVKYIAKFPAELVRFTLENEQNINCVAHNKIARQIMLLPDQSSVALFGHYNKRNQLIVDKMFVRSIPQGLIKS